MSPTTKTVMLTTVVVALLTGFFFLLPTPPSPPGKSVSNSFAISSVRVFDGSQTLEGVDVLVEDGLIKAMGKDIVIPSGVRLIDGRGKTLLPGLIDAHVHSFGPSRQDALRFGVTTELDMFTDWRQ